MLCQKCKKNEATTHYTQIINGKRQELHLCAECATKQNLNVFGDLPNLFGSMFFGEPQHRRMSTGSVRACPKCGMTLDEIAASVGLRPETVSRTISGFAKDGLVRRAGRGRLLILDHDGLQALV